MSPRHLFSGIWIFSLVNGRVYFCVWELINHLRVFKRLGFLGGKIWNKKKIISKTNLNFGSLVCREQNHYIINLERKFICPPLKQPKDRDLHSTVTENVFH